MPREWTHETGARALAQMCASEMSFPHVYPDSDVFGTRRPERLVKSDGDFDFQPRAPRSGHVTTTEWSTRRQSWGVFAAAAALLSTLRKARLSRLTAGKDPIAHVRLAICANPAASSLPRQVGWQIRSRLGTPVLALPRRLFTQFSADESLSSDLLGADVDLFQGHPMGARRQMIALWVVFCSILKTCKANMVIGLSPTCRVDFSQSFKCTRSCAQQRSWSQELRKTNSGATYLRPERAAADAKQFTILATSS